MRKNMSLHTKIKLKYRLCKISDKQKSSNILHLKQTVFISLKCRLAYKHILSVNLKFYCISK